MTHITQSALVGFGISALMLIAYTLPTFTHAAQYAYVNSFGFVGLVIAANPSDAIRNAINIDTHSGVCLLSTEDEEAMVGDFVQGA